MNVLVLTSESPVEVSENTTIYVLLATTGIERPVSKQFEIFPIETTPVNGGAKLHVVPATGVRILLGVVETHSWICGVTVVPISVEAMVVDA